MKSQLIEGILNNLDSKISRRNQIKAIKHRGKFNPKLLPSWARRCVEVAQLCEINVAFRKHVQSATDPEYKRILIRKAREVVGGRTQ